jgi:predicted transcriptional regulator
VLGTVWELRERRLATRSGRAEYRLTERGHRVMAALTTAASLFQ